MKTRLSGLKRERAAVPGVARQLGRCQSAGLLLHPLDPLLGLGLQSEAVLEVRGVL